VGVGVGVNTGVGRVKGVGTKTGVGKNTGVGIVIGVGKNTGVGIVIGTNTGVGRAIGVGTKTGVGTTTGIGVGVGVGVVTLVLFTLGQLASNQVRLNRGGRMKARTMWTTPLVVKRSNLANVVFPMVPLSNVRGRVVLRALRLGKLRLNAATPARSPGVAQKLGINWGMIV